MMWGWDGAMGVWGWLWSLVPIALLVAALAWSLSILRPREPTGSPPAEDSALRILRERYARGEIDQEEFETRRRELSH